CTERIDHDTHRPPASRPRVAGTGVRYPGELFGTLCVIVESDGSSLPEPEFFRHPSHDFRRRLRVAAVRDIERIPNRQNDAAHRVEAGHRVRADIAANSLPDPKPTHHDRVVRHWCAVGSVAETQCADIELVGLYDEMLIVALALDQVRTFLPNAEATHSDFERRARRAISPRLRPTIGKWGPGQDTHHTARPIRLTLPINDVIGRGVPEYPVAVICRRSYGTVPRTESCDARLSVSDKDKVAVQQRNVTDARGIALCGDTEILFELVGGEPAHSHKPVLRERVLHCFGAP